MKHYIIVHNKQDEQSRRLVSELWQIQTADSICVLDWYTDERERWRRTCACHRGEPFYGVPPSAMPEIHTQKADGTWGRIRLAQSLEDRMRPETDWDWQNYHGTAIGGQWLEHIPATIRSVEPELSRVIEKAFESHLKLFPQLSVHAKIV